MAPALLVFLRISAPFVYVIERTAAALSRAIGLQRDHPGGGHSAEELKFIVESSRREGHLAGFEEDAIQKILELEDVNAREIMTPRIDIVSVPVDATLDELLRVAVEHKYLAAAGVSGFARKYRRDPALQGSDARLAGAQDRPPIAVSPRGRSACGDSCATRWWCPKPSR